ncbi:MAG TPA: adenylate/guanylate cyclase domain-containing protein [Candidatus Dormibacteraeota bacterium]|nr:adenylate/guanylate cyclase domain-containing protein [Candidatus Dormibacteraeota bacterium]
MTVLFADLVGFTTLSADRDPEAVRELLSRYFERSKDIVGRYGGTIEKFIGDAVMAVWGTPIAREDDAERAVRAALELVDAVPALAGEGGPELQVRAGVLSGEAAVTLGATDQGMVAGDLVNTASRLQSVAAPGTVLVGETTRMATESSIAYEPAGEQILKGKSAPVPAWRALRVVAERGGGRRQERNEPPFVGRAEDLRFLKEQYHATGRERRARLISLVGQAGIGKSRLAWELEKYLDGVVETVWWHRGRSPSYGDGVTFWALGEMIRRRAGIVEGADEATTRQAVAEMLGLHIPSAEERAWIEPRLLALLGVAETPTGGREELFAAWRTFFERLAADRTVALVFEDLQWADDGLLDFLEHLLDWARTHPIFVLTLARPELLDRRPGWGSDRRGAISVRLEPLSNEAMHELLAGIAPNLPADIVRRILERADGVPLYAVETVRMLVARGNLVDDHGALVVAGDLDELEVPPTLRELVGARLDALSKEDRGLVEDASVLGHSFTLAALAALSGDAEGALATRLGGLVRREILTIETDPRAPTRGQHAFVQALLREVAYATLSRRDRRSRHLAAARYFEGLGDEELAGVLATHYIAAYHAAPEGPEGDAVGAQARIALAAASERAEALGALEQAATTARAALEVTADAPGRATLLERIGRLEAASSHYEAAVATLAAAIAEYERIGDRAGALRAGAATMRAELPAGWLDRAAEVAATWLATALELADNAAAAPAVAQYWGVVANLDFRRAAFEEAIAGADRAIRLGEPLGRDEIVAHALVTKGSALAGLERFRESAALLRGAMADAEEHGIHDAAIRAGVNLAGTTGDADPKGSLELTRHGIEVTRRLGIRFYDGYFAGNATVAVRVGEWTWLRETLAELIAVDPERSETGWIRSVLNDLDLWSGAARIDEARSRLERALTTGDFQSVNNLRAFLVKNAYAQGDDEAALEVGRALLSVPYGWFSDIGLTGRIAARLGEAADADRALATLTRVPNGAIRADALLLRATIDAIAGRELESLAGFRSAIASYRGWGLRFDVALAGLAAAEVLPRSMPAVVAAADESRSIAAELGATRVLALLDRALEDRPADMAGRPPRVSKGPPQPSRLR